MKKTIALILALMMIATIALALDFGNVYPGSKLTIPLTDADKAPRSGSDFTTGDFAVLYHNSSAVAWDSKKEITAKNFSISSVKWTEGGKFVKSVTINSDDEIVIELNQDYTLVLGKNKAVKGSFKVNQKSTGKTNTIIFGDYGIRDVGYEKGYIALSTNGAALLGTNLPAENTVYVATKLSNVVDTTTLALDEKAAPTDATYGTLDFEDAMGNGVSVRVYEDEKYYLYSDTDANVTVVKNNDGTEADLRFVKFPAKPTFNATATYSVYAEKDEFVYSIDDKGNLALVGKWSEDDGCWIIKTRTLGAYLISDKALKATSTTTSANPDTGVNSVAGVAGALAAVAMISAAAFSIKK